ncbi:MAG TPA: replication-associated recombination protein A [Atribacteraceae bacterium]|nr:replication-associated recombination protein A [Atribacteraceae bacterium]
MRPRTLGEVVGQPELAGPEGILSRIVRDGFLPSLLFWGPPGTGKTSVAFILAETCGYHTISVSAVASGVKDMKEAIREAEFVNERQGNKTVFFIDEIHRFHKGQQSFLLPFVEKGTITLLGATTENPSFEVIAPLLSRCQVLLFRKISVADLVSLLRQTLTDPRALNNPSPMIGEDALELLARMADGDARQALNFLEIILQVAQRENRTVSPDIIGEIFHKNTLLYDKSGEEHYNLLSAYHKSLRGSDPDGAVYWMCRMLESGEDPHVILRRLIACASEDIGNADPRALQVAVAAREAYDFLGEPEGRLSLAQATLYVASAPKSNASYRALQVAASDVRIHGALPVPVHLRNAPTRLLAELGYGQEYKYAHDFPEGFIEQDYRPPELSARLYYRPSGRGYEKMISQWLQVLWKKRKY